jgi:hypothetical protein
LISRIHPKFGAIQIHLTRESDTLAPKTSLQGEELAIEIQRMDAELIDRFRNQLKTASRRFEQDKDQYVATVQREPSTHNASYVWFAHPDELNDPDNGFNHVSNRESSILAQAYSGHIQGSVNVRAVHVEAPKEILARLLVLVNPPDQPSGK